ncbi:MAG: magnesium transporter CorA family protein [Patescibacteria group bacterium]|jgi:magnesium transporter
MKKIKQLSKKIRVITIDNPKGAGKIEWYNIFNPEKKEIDYLKKKFSFDDKHLKSSLTKVSAQRPMIYQGKNYLFLIMHFPVLINGRISPGEIEFFIGHGFLITLHDGKTKSLDNFFDYCQKESIFLESYQLESSAILLYEILEKLIQDSYELLDKNNIEINKVEKIIFSQKQKIITSQLLLLKSNIINIRRTVQNHKNIMKKLTEMKSSLVPTKKIISYYDLLAEHSQRIWEFSEIQKEIIESLHDTSESIMSYRINNIMKTLTVVSVILMPLNLIASMLGMNMEPNPLKTNSGLLYLIYVVIIMLFLASVMLIFFKKKKWL